MQILYLTMWNLRNMVCYYFLHKENCEKKKRRDPTWDRKRERGVGGLDCVIAFHDNRFHLVCSKTREFRAKCGQKCGSWKKEIKSRLDPVRYYRNVDQSLSKRKIFVFKFIIEIACWKFSEIKNFALLLKNEIRIRTWNGIF